jgi:hypothetical protein
VRGSKPSGKKVPTSRVDCQRPCARLTVSTAVGHRLRGWRFERRAVEHPRFRAFCCAAELDLRGVDVTLSDACLGVACALLDVGEGVAGGCVVGEGCVAEVVEGAEGFADGRSVEGGAEVFAGEPGGVDWGAFLGVAEDEFVVALEGRDQRPISIGENHGAPRNRLHGWRHPDRATAPAARHEPRTA